MDFNDVYNGEQWRYFIKIINDYYVYVLIDFYQ